MARFKRLLGIAAALLVLPVSAQAAFFSTGTLQAQDDLFFDIALGSLGQIDLSTYTPNGVMLDYSSHFFQFSGTTTWTGTSLLNDASLPSGLARGQFDGDGHFTVTGTLKNVLLGGMVIFDGVLIEGDVPASTFEELVNASSNQFGSDAFVPLVNAAGGLIDGIDIDGALSGTELLYILQPSIRPVWAEVRTVPGGDPLTDLTSASLAASAGSQIQLRGANIPEPATLLLFGLAAPLLARRRNRHS
jgi:hypothetical protein